MFKSKNVDMLNGSITMGLIILAIPILLMNVINNLYNTLDMVILGKFASDTAVGAVGACSYLIGLFTNFFLGVSLGVNVLVAKFIGQGDKSKSEKAVGTSLAISFWGGIILAILGILLAEISLNMTNCPPDLLKDAVLYFRLYFLGVPFVFIYNFAAAILRSIGDSKRPMYFIVLSGFIKVILTFVFAYFNTGVVGVALATIISFILAAILCLNALKHHTEHFSFTINKIKFTKSEFKEILKIGIPAGLQRALYSIANVVIATAVNSFGKDATTGVSIANQFDNILYNIATAIPLAATPYVAQNVGAKNLSRTKKAIVYGMLMTIAIGASFGALSAIFAEQLSSIISTTPEVIKFSCQKMVIVSSTYFICGINELLGGVMRGLGRNNIPTVTTLLFMCALRFVWVYFVFPYYPNLTFLYLVWPIGWVLCIVTQLLYYFPTIKKFEKSFSDA